MYGHGDPQEGGLGVDVAVEGDPVGSALNIESGDRRMMGYLGNIEQVRKKNFEVKRKKLFFSVRQN